MCGGRRHRRQRARGSVQPRVKRDPPESRSSGRPNRFSQRPAKATSSGGTPPSRRGLQRRHFLRTRRHLHEVLFQSISSGARTEGVDCLEVPWRWSLSALSTPSPSTAKKRKSGERKESPLNDHDARHKVQAPQALLENPGVDDAVVRELRAPPDCPRRSVGGDPDGGLGKKNLAGDPLDRRPASSLVSRQRHPWELGDQKERRDQRRRRQQVVSVVRLRRPARLVC